MNTFSGFFHKKLYMTPFGNKISAIDKIWIDLAPNFYGLLRKYRAHFHLDQM